MLISGGPGLRHISVIDDKDGVRVKDVDVGEGRGTFGALRRWKIESEDVIFAS